MSARLRRLARIEAAIGRLNRCPVCGDHPTRILGIDPETGEATSETMPKRGCGECGRAPYRELQIAGVDVAQL